MELILHHVFYRLLWYVGAPEGSTMRFLKKELTKAYTLVHVRREFREQRRNGTLNRERAPEPPTAPPPK
ncbi:MAG TPA: hypothetical protein ENI71_04580 [Chromatiales bacterium]|nr:hypothetical protein [Chromatiales bacterium]